MYRYIYSSECMMFAFLAFLVSDDHVIARPTNSEQVTQHISSQLINNMEFLVLFLVVACRGPGLFYYGTKSGI